MSFNNYNLLWVLILIIKYLMYSCCRYLFSYIITLFEDSLLCNCINDLFFIRVFSWKKPGKTHSWVFFLYGLQIFQKLPLGVFLENSRNSTFQSFSSEKKRTGKNPLGVFSCHPF
ncbi:unnamed protein product [Blepharisma stoltei]|uniref:Secreted protein n=1 Tax=Blepharisma stoltei TaxID=1481888 RepID=A0AAU9JVL1_9CILI|nr:unnamed protein product [Blepharisma stoltei]